jgi:transposase
MYRSPKLWKRIRTRILKNGESRNSVAKIEGISRATVRKMLRNEHPLDYGGKELLPPHKTKSKTKHKSCKVNKAEISRHRWLEWLASLAKRKVSDDLPKDLLAEVIPSAHSRSIKAMTLLAKHQGFSNNEIANFLSISRVSVRRYIKEYADGGASTLFSRAPRPLLTDDENIQKAIFNLLHEPPSTHGFNRTTWKMCDLKATLKLQGHDIGYEIIRRIIKNAGFRWRSAKVVLTSNDPDYREKLEKVQAILSNLKSDERFFSIDEFGPFAVKMKPGRVLVTADQMPSVPQWQKSKGCLILTAALELSSNQVCHFYSTAKNTDEMIKMAKVLIEKYADCRKLYLSWDAASWHMSKKLLKFINENNDSETHQRPEIELAPLPASAQFLNVIESVFSGMARAIIHSSDYQSVTEAKEAIDRYFSERNQHYQEHPKKAGKKIWGLERVSSEFNSSNNCKDPAFR